MGLIESFAWIGLVIAATTYILSLLVFFRILALKEQRMSNGLIKEIFSLNPNKWFRGEYIDIFPLTALSVLFQFRRIDKDILGEKLVKLYKLKILLDIIIILLFLGGLVLVAVQGIYF
jgi:hypothetical protein